MIQIAPSTDSRLRKPSGPASTTPWRGIVEFLAGDAGDGIASELEARSRAVPVAPTAVERMKPGLDRSMRYQRTGLTSARVREACRVEVQGRRL
jgi:hypothetical protein